MPLRQSFSAVRFNGRVQKIRAEIISALFILLKKGIPPRRDAFSILKSFCDYYLAGALLYARHAACALCVVYHGQFVHHGYCTVGAVLCAYAAAYAAYFAL